MGKVIDGGLAPKDHPLFTGGWTIHTHKTLGQAIKELEKDIEEQNKKEKPQENTNGEIL